MFWAAAWAQPGQAHQDLTASPQSQRTLFAQRTFYVEKCLVQIELVFIGRSRPSDAARENCTFELSEHPERLGVGHGLDLGVVRVGFLGTRGRTRRPLADTVAFTPSS